MCFIFIFQLEYSTNDSFSNSKKSRINPHTEDTMRFRFIRSSNLNADQVEFVEQPQDSFLSGSLPVLVECVVKNAGQSYIECQNKIRNDLTRNISIKNDVKYEKLSLLVNRKDFDSDESNERLVCHCVAFSHISNQKYFSDRAVITNSCKKTRLKTILFFSTRKF